MIWPCALNPSSARQGRQPADRDVRQGRHPASGVAKGGSSTGGRNVPVIRTIASLRLSSSGTDCDLMIIDEAYQATFADVAAAADHAQQVLFVGTPARSARSSPSSPTPSAARTGHRTCGTEVFSQLEGAAIFALDTTYRLGQETVDAISCLYDFPFTSSRPDRYLTDAFGNRASEIVGLKSRGRGRLRLPAHDGGRRTLRRRPGRHRARRVR
jgi:hypothetical protein